jgi:hypothetical protein
LDSACGPALGKTLASSLRISQAIAWPIHRSIRSCIFTRLTLSSGLLWHSLPRVSSGQLFRVASE